MRIALISEYNLVLTTGGTEYYTDMLAKGLSQEGHDVLFISKGAHSRGLIEKQIRDGQVSFRLLLLPAESYNRAEVRQKVVSSSWELISLLLQQFRPDVVHIHTMTTFFGRQHIEACRAAFPVMIFTSHVPGHFCIKGDLIQNNKKPCDGVIGRKCNVCLFYAGFKLGMAGLMSNYVGKQRKLLEFFSGLQIDIVCVSEWQKKQLLANGFPTSKLHKIRQAIRSDQYQGISTTVKKKFRIGYLGRLSPEKGSVFLFNLIRSLGGSEQVEFVLGIPPNSDPAATAELQHLINEEDVTVSLRSDINALNKHIFFSEIDCLLIPTFVVETGPIVLLEAVLYGKKVVAPNAGGPLEFAQEFPGTVVCYEWNDCGDAIKKLNQVMRSAATDASPQVTYFQKKQWAFIQDHIRLYQNVLNRLPATVAE